MSNFVIKSRVTVTVSLSTVNLQPKMKKHVCEAGGGEGWGEKAQQGVGGGLPSQLFSPPPFLLSSEARK